MDRSEFPRFKSFLQEKFPEDGRYHRAIQDATLASIYMLALTLHVSPEQMARWIANFLQLPYVETIESSSVELSVLPASFSRANFVVALEDDGAFVVSNPFDWQVIGSLLDLKPSDSPLKVFVTEPDKITDLFRQRRREELAESGGISEIVHRLQDRYSTGQSSRADVQVGDVSSEPIIQLTNRLVEEAYAMGASDLHLEPAEDSVVVRYRVDGELRIVHDLKPRSLIRPLASRIKIMCGLDIAERRLPQDGRIVFKEFSEVDSDFDLRVSTAPMQHGEKIVMRIVDKAKSVLPLSALGFSGRCLDVYREKIRSPYGMILHVGPTGSGKSMTLYAALNEMQRPEINIQTAEDPIEYSIPGINQLQVYPSIGMTFGRALRCYLRQDPDIILLGEVRDIETAQIAVEASLTGHLLLSTLHTNDAASTVTRLIQMGVEPFMVSSSIVLICAQRLVRRLCRECKEPYSPDLAERRFAGISDEDDDAKLWCPKGCDKCSGIGYQGRFGVHEILVPNDALRLSINRAHVTAEALKKIAVEDCGLTTLWWDAMEKARAGVTSVEEVFSKVRPDEFDSRPRWMRSAARDAAST